MAPAADSLHRHARRRAGFVLVEVLLSLTILGIAAMAFLKSFTYSLNAARKMEVMTQAGFFVSQLEDEFELFPPPEGDSGGTFGDDYPNFSYRAHMEYVDPDYDHLSVPDDVEQFFAMREVRIEIIYDDGQHNPYKAADVTTGIMGFEKFSAQSKMSYSNY